jgi:hypothetical protein
MEKVNFKFVEHLDRYPPVIGRDQINEYFPWLSKQTMANLDLEGKGPKGSFKCGRRRLYPSIQLLEWLDERVQQSSECKKVSSSPKIEKVRFQKSRLGRKTKQQEVRERQG